MSVSSRLMPLLALAMTMMVGCSVTPNEQPAALANADVENPDQVTCKTVVKTGTRIGTRVCKTNREWALGDRSGRNMVEDIQRRSAMGQSDPNAGG